ncbi:hypothetical protein GCM10007036_30240 [Alsobacter metallidurans]|uniref:Uncharacterized protein n=1 Tax=Alsobacter metallidurans TaxID=340221 RepID=A0A917I8I0_9HYPH|nr:hypothetical protein GCM10007036_30240 [Alsobacter metallidurans]
MTPLTLLLQRHLPRRFVGVTLFIIYTLVAVACLITIGLPTDRSYYVDVGR